MSLAKKKSTFAGQANVSMEDHRLPADNQISDLVKGQEPHEGLRVGREVCRVYFDRCHARTSFESAG